MSMHKVVKTSPQVAFVYDRVAAEGGAERVLQMLHEAFPDSPIYTSFWNADQAPWSAGWDIRTSFLQRLPRGLRRYRWWGWIMPLAFESMNFSDFDIVVSVCGESAKAVITQPNQLHICYLLNPTRYLWSHSEQTAESIPRLLQPIAKKVIHVLQRWDKVIAQRPDVIVPISHLVANRCVEFYDRETSEPLSPPIPQFQRQTQPEIIPEGSFLFTWGRHVAYKRFDLSIEAACAEKVQLIIGGEGPETQRLRRLAKQRDPKGRWIHFVGRVSDAELVWYLQNAQGAVFPQVEDFGIAPGEAVAQGCPVAVHQDSGITEILPHQGLVTIEAENVAAVRKAISKLTKKSRERLDSRAFARHYSGVQSIRRWRKLLEDAWQKYQAK